MTTTQHIPLVSISTLFAQKRSEFTGTVAEWETIKAGASYVIAAAGDETVFGENEELLEYLVTASTKAPYGDVHYCDPGYQSDKKKRYPVDTAEHVRAAWSYIHQAKNAAKYSSGDLSKVRSCIASAWKSKIDKGGPPSAKKD